MKKNGFTLVELIVVIVLIGIIAIIFVPYIDDIITGNKERVYSSYMKKMVLASENYMINRNIAVNASEPLLYINLNNLIDDGLISDSDCSGYVKVHYIEEENTKTISKDAYLNCKDYRTEGYE